MGKLLRVLVFFILLFSIGSLVLGILLFNRRELLKGRTQSFERKVKALAAFIEDGEAKIETPQNFVERDTDDCNDGVLESPSKGSFWADKYDQNLEAAYDTSVTLEDDVLKRFYKKDTATGKYAREEATGMKITLGDDVYPTMENILRDMVAKAEKQLTLLNTTREQLIVLRKELGATIDELNKRKHELREAKTEITRLNGVIADLRSEIADLKTTIEGLKSEIVGLNGQIEELNAIIAKRDETIEDRDSEIKDLIARLNEAMERIRTQDGGGTVLGVAGRVRVKNINEGAPGIKGEIKTVNDTWGFVVVKLNDEAIADWLRDDEAGAYVKADLWVKRQIKGRDRMIARLKLIQIKREGALGIANILPEWKQQELRVGDTVFWP